ncbi:MAG: serine hydrolase [Acidobacteria bacterium]|nr:serine hydrolase [Acidobacteriota bacterium]
MHRRTLLAGGLAALGRGWAAKFEADGLEQAAGFLDKAVQSGRVRAASLTVWQGDRRFERGFGGKYGVDSIFLIASITKTMTSTGLLVLADRGELKLSDRAVKYLPEFSEGDRKDITIEQLLTHTSGLPDMLPENNELRKEHQPLSEFVDRAMHTPLLFKPGSKYSYQSMGILLASEIAQRITGLPFPTFLEREVFEPLKMTRTTLGMADMKMEDVEMGQVQTAAPEAGSGDPSTKSWDWNSPYWRRFGAPWGGAHSTGSDIARFLHSYLHPDGRVLRVETARNAIVNHNQGLDTPRGIGFTLGSKANSPACSEQTFGHGGSTGTLCWADPRTETICVVLTTLPGGAVKPHPRELAADRVAEAVA